MNFPTTPAVSFRHLAITLVAALVGMVVSPCASSPPLSDPQFKRVSERMNISGVFAMRFTSDSNSLFCVGTDSLLFRRSRGGARAWELVALAEGGYRMAPELGVRMLCDAEDIGTTSTIRVSGNAWMYVKGASGWQPILSDASSPRSPVAERIDLPPLQTWKGVPPENLSRALAIDASSDGQYLAWSDPSGVYLQELGREPERLVTDKELLVAPCLKFTPDGDQVIVGSTRLMVYDVSTRALVSSHALRGPGVYVCAEISEDGSLVAVGSFAGAQEEDWDSSAVELWLMSELGQVSSSTGEAHAPLFRYQLRHLPLESDSVLSEYIRRGMVGPCPEVSD